MNVLMQQMYGRNQYKQGSFGRCGQALSLTRGQLNGLSMPFTVIQEGTEIKGNMRLRFNSKKDCEKHATALLAKFDNLNLTEFNLDD